MNYKIDVCELPDVYGSSSLEARRWLFGLLLFGAAEFNSILMG
jgi:hypothetical protein